MKGSFFVWRLSRIFSILIIFSFLFVFNVTTVSANTIKVNTTEDQDDTDPDHCSLREAIKAADTDTAYGGCNAGSGADIITLSAGVYTVYNSLVDYISSDITINGIDSATTIIQPADCNPNSESCTNNNQFVWVSSGTLSLNNLTMRYWKNTNDNNGGVLLNQSNLNISNCIFYANRASRGGAFMNSSLATANITNSTFLSNFAKNASDTFTEGGAIYNSGTGTLNIENSTFSENHGNLGGALVNLGTLEIINSTFSGNQGDQYGGAIINAGTVDINHSTFSENVSLNGAGIYNNEGNTMNYSNTLIANSLTGSDCVNEGTIIQNENNLVEDGGCNSDYFGDPSLGPLADNGGPTKTHALLPDSNAIDAGSPFVGQPYDQRGVSRPQPEGGDFDIGAFEYKTTSIFLPLLMK